jgi:hypothetical protein
MLDRRRGVAAQDFVKRPLRARAHQLTLKTGPTAPGCDRHGPETSQGRCDHSSYNRLLLRPHLTAPELEFPIQVESNEQIAGKQRSGNGLEFARVADRLPMAREERATDLQICNRDRASTLGASYAS